MIFIIGSVNFAGKAILANNIYTVDHPESLYRTFNIIDLFRLIIYRIGTYFESLVLVIRISLVTTIISTVVILLIAMKVWFYRYENHKYVRRKRKSFNLLLPRIKKIVTENPKDMTLEEVTDTLMTGLDLHIATFKEAAFFLKVFNQYIFIDREHSNVSNAYKALRALGYIEFLEYKLLKGSDREKNVAIQFAILLNLNISVSYMSRIINSENIPLRKLARMYYMMMNHEDSYKYLYQSSFKFSLWDEIEMHRIIKLCKLDNKPLPVFMSAVRLEKENLNIAFFIQEAGYYGQDIEIEAMKPYLIDADEKIRRAAIKCMTFRRVNSAVDLIKQAVPISTQHTVRLCLRSLLVLHEGDQAPFFKHVYQLSSDYRTRHVALICLWLYSKESIKIYNELYLEANDVEKKIFNEVKVRIKLDKLYGGILNVDNTISIIQRYVTDTI